jgi:hypothetical protein
VQHPYYVVDMTGFTGMESSIQNSWAFMFSGWRVGVSIIWSTVP